MIDPGTHSTKMKHVQRSLLALSLTALLGACASPFPKLEPVKPLPAEAPSYKAPEGVKAVGVTSVQDERWWDIVNIPTLSDVIEKALEHNTDVRLAEQRLNEAGAALGIARTAKWPAVFGQFDSRRNRPTQAGNVPVFGNREIYETSSAMLGVSWELDLWGRLGDLEDAAQARFMQQGYNYKAVRLSVSATAATLYTRVRVFGLLLKVAEDTLQSRQESLNLQRQRLEAGLTNELQFRQVEAEYLAVLAQLPDLREQYENVNNALSVLLGGDVPPIPELGTEGLYLSPVAIVPEGVSSDLLLRRPDLASAEQGLLAAQANLSAARKAFFPNISLTGALGSESADLSDLFSGPARVWNASVNLTQPIFQAGRLNSEQDVAVARSNQAVIAYESAIRAAFAEVYDSLIAQREARERFMARTEQVQSLQALVNLARQRVEAGVSSQIELLDAQRALLNAQLDWARAWGAQQAALLSVVKALGGGFQVSAPGMPGEPAV